jgi:hypothetical protein
MNRHHKDTAAPLDEPAHDDDGGDLMFDDDALVDGGDGDAR